MKKLHPYAPLTIGLLSVACAEPLRPLALLNRLDAREVHVEANPVRVAHAMRVLTKNGYLDKPWWGCYSLTPKGEALLDRVFEARERLDAPRRTA